MRLYLDTSALVKLYVVEDGSSLVRRFVAEAETVATSLVTYVEARAALSRRRREGILAVPDYNRILREFNDEWKRYFVMDITNPLVKNAAMLAELHALRGYDAIQLASAESFREKINDPVVFGCWDSRLEAAARRQGLQLLRPVQ
ncbi:MAG: type II toxin-antitoxin system VapC family toxin [Candidatus Binatia bacterium]